MENNNNKKPRYFYVGQTVCHGEFGKGLVKSTTKSQPNPILVEFEHNFTYFTFDGRRHKRLPVSLSQTPIPEIQNEPLPEMPDLKIGDLVLVKDAIDDSWQVSFFAGYSNNVYSKFLASRVFPPTQANSVCWALCEKYDPKKLKPAQ